MIANLPRDAHVRLAALNATTMIGLGLALFWVRDAVTTMFFDYIGGALSFLLILASLLFIALSDWLIAVDSGGREVSRLRRLLTLSTVASAAAFGLTFIPASTTRMLCYFLAAYALLLGIGKVYLALRWKGSLGVKLTMWALAVVALCFCGTLIGVAGKPEWTAVTVLASYSLFAGLQMSLCSIFLFRMSRSMEVGADRAMPEPKQA